MAHHTHGTGGNYLKGCDGCKALERERRQNVSAQSRDRRNLNQQLTRQTPEGHLRARQARWAAQGMDVEQATTEYLSGKTTCDICGNPSKSRALHIDHDHATGQVRGTLCHSCNSLLGYAKDSPELLAKAIEYLQAPITESTTMPVIVYTQPGCQPCKAVARKLTLEGIPFETIDITEDPAAAEMLRKAGFTGTPVIHHDGELHNISGLVGIVTAHREVA